MKFYRNMKFAGKMMLLVIPFFLALIALLVFFSIRIQKTNEDTKQALYNETFVSTAAILNADRDYYQAAIAEKELYLQGKDISHDEQKALLADYEENAAQVLERINTALDNISDNPALYSNFPHETSGKTIEELETAFKNEFAQWKSLYDPQIGEGDMAEKLIAFDDARNEINEMTEILEAYAEQRSVEIKESIQSSLTLSIGVIVAIIISLGALAIYLILSIRRRLRDVTNASLRIAQGDLSVSINEKDLTKDEIGQLTATIDNEVRKAFKNIAKAQKISEKQNQYQNEQVDKLVVNLERLAKGELNCDMTVSEADEDTKEIYNLFKNISDNLHMSIDTIKEYIEDISEVLGEVSEKNLNTEISKEYRGDFIELKNSINRIIDGLNETMTEINTSSDQVAAGTQQVSDGSQEISQGATEQASSIEELTASTTQIAEQTRRNAENANQANELTLTAKNNAARGNEQMKTMQQAMMDINESSTNINKIIKVIDDIAFQTNILALNAAVEAARAGVHGKGFAVVAEEVRNLAAKSADAANQTTDLIEGSIKKTEAGTKIADDTATALVGIVDGVDKVADLVGTIASASNEQAAAIAQVNNGIEQMSQVVQTNSATSEEQAAAAEELSSQAEVLKGMVGQFRLKAEHTKIKHPKTKKPEVENAKAEVQQEPQIRLSNTEFGKY